MDRVVALELSCWGSHGMAAHSYPELLALVEAGRLRPDLLVRRHVGLDQAGAALAAVGAAAGITVVTP
jgi:alcohol dehydrogenase